MPTTIAYNGFFSDEAKSISAQSKADHKQLFFYLAETNEHAHKFLAKLKVRSNDLKEALTAALLARAVTGFQALVFLAERGFDSEMRATCRSLIEAKFKLAFLAEEPEAAKLIVFNHEKERAKRLRAMRDGIVPIHRDLVQVDWEILIAQAEANQKDADGKKKPLPSIAAIATRCGLEGDYRGAYSFCSDATHSGAGELDFYLEFNPEKNEATNFRYGPNAGPWIPWITLMGAGYLINCMEIVSIIFALNKDRRSEIWFNSRFKRHDEMKSRYKDEVSDELRAGKR